MPPQHATSRRLRLFSATAAAGCLVLGLALQLLDHSVLVDAAGGALYVCLIGLLVGAVWPALSSATIASAAFAFAAAIELLQLTELPRAIVGAFPPARLLLGSAFDPLDFVAYAGGALLLFVAHFALVRAASRPRSATSG